jgi:hypothetical protein
MKATHLPSRFLSDGGQPTTGDRWSDLAELKWVAEMTGAGIEPAARALKVRCSTTELPGRGWERSV